MPEIVIATQSSPEVLVSSLITKRKIATQDKPPSSEYSSFLKQQRGVTFQRVSAENADHLRYRPNARSAGKLLCR